MTFNTTLYREPEVEVTVEYCFHGGCRGARDSLCGKRGAGPPLEPDEPDEIEIESITDDTGKEMECTEVELVQIEEAAWQDLAEKSEP